MKYYDKISGKRINKQMVRKRMKVFNLWMSFAVVPDSKKEALQILKIVRGV